MIICPPHDYMDPTMAYIVKDEMIKLGPPRIRAYYDGEIYRAIEGTHRLWAADYLGYFPEIIEVSLHEIIADHDFPDLPERCTVHDIIDYIGNTEPYDFSERKK